MSETFRSTPTEQQWSGSNGYQGTYAENASVNYEDTENTGGNEAGKALLVGVLGGLLSTPDTSRIAGSRTIRKSACTGRLKTCCSSASTKFDKISIFKHS